MLENNIIKRRSLTPDPLASPEPFDLPNLETLSNLTEDREN